MSRLNKNITGPNGTFRVDKADYMGIPGGLWSVEEVIEGPTIDSTHVGAFQTVIEAIECAHRVAGLGEIRTKPAPPIPKVDRRGLVAHSRKL